MLAATLAGLLAAAAPAQAAEAGATAGKVVEKVVAVIRNPPGSAPRIVTLTRLEEEARIALVGRGALEAASRPIDGPALRATLDWLVDEMLVADEAARLRLDELDREALAAEVRRFAARFPTEADYQRFLAAADLAEEELAASLARGLRVRRYLASRVGRVARVADADVDRLAAERGLAPSSDAVRDAIRAELVEARARVQARELVAELRGHADVRVLERFEPTPAEGGG
jgi:hypothetical protein